MSNTELVKVTPAEMIMAAVTANTDLDKLKGLLELQIAWEANEARKAFYKAMSEFKKEEIVVTKDKLNKQYSSNYTTLGNLVNTVNPILSKHGLSASWDIKQNGTISVSCKISHLLGHNEEGSPISAPADSSGSKNPIQQIKSTITYLKSVTFESICGLASSDANVDDDGNGSVERITDKQLSQILDLITTRETTETKLCDFLKVDKLENLPATDFMKALQAVNNAKRKE